MSPSCFIASPTSRRAVPEGGREEGRKGGRKEGREGGREGGRGGRRWKRDRALLKDK